MPAKPDYKEPGWGSALDACLDELSAAVAAEAKARADAVAQVEAAARETYVRRDEAAGLDRLERRLADVEAQLAALQAEK